MRLATRIPSRGHSFHESPGVAHEPSEPEYPRQLACNGLAVDLLLGTVEERGEGRHATVAGCRSRVPDDDRLFGPTIDDQHVADLHLALIARSVRMSYSRETRDSDGPISWVSAFGPSLQPRRLVAPLCVLRFSRCERMTVQDTWSTFSCVAFDCPIRAKSYRPAGGVAQVPISSGVPLVLNWRAVVLDWRVVVLDCPRSQLGNEDESKYVAVLPDMTLVGGIQWRGELSTIDTPTGRFWSGIKWRAISLVVIRAGDRPRRWDTGGTSKGCTRPIGRATSTRPSPEQG